MPVECEVAPLVRGLFKSDIRPDERVLRWFEPSAALAPFVQRIWSAHWRIPAGEHRLQPILPYPSANLVLGRGTADILGVVTRAAIQRLEGVGSAFGVKLSAVRAFGVERPSLIRDKSAPAADLLAGPPLCRVSEDPEAIAREIESYLLAHAPNHDVISLKSREIVELAEIDREIVSVSRLAHALRLWVRSVQDICQRALGVLPKWLIRCFRVQDALSRLGVGSDVNLSALAQELGYFDQAHFTRDFKRVTGVSPGRYRLEDARFYKRHKPCRL
jgi:AraC-like DNA-binding protein